MDRTLQFKILCIELMTIVGSLLSCNDDYSDNRIEIESEINALVSNTPILKKFAEIELHHFGFRYFSGKYGEKTFYARCIPVDGFIVGYEENLESGEIFRYLLIVLNPTGVEPGEFRFESVSIELDEEQLIGLLKGEVPREAEKYNGYWEDWSPEFQDFFMGRYFAF